MLSYPERSRGVALQDLLEPDEQEWACSVKVHYQQHPFKANQGLSMTANGLRGVDDGREQAWPPQRYEAEDDGILVLPLVWTHYATGTSSTTKPWLWWMHWLTSFMVALRRSEGADAEHALHAVPGAGGRHDAARQRVAAALREAHAPRHRAHQPSHFDLLWLWL